MYCPYSMTDLSNVRHEKSPNILVEQLCVSWELVQSKKYVTEGRKLNFDLISTFLCDLDKELFVGNAHKCSIEDWFREAWRSEGGNCICGRERLSVSILRICYLIWLGLDVRNLQIFPLNFSDFREWTQECKYLLYVNRWTCILSASRQSYITLKLVLLETKLVDNLKDKKRIHEYRIRFNISDTRNNEEE
jgi:hypothetical protein